MRIEANTIKNYEDKARQKALLEGIGKQEGIAEGKKQIALKLLLKKTSIEDIAEITGLRASRKYSRLPKIFDRLSISIDWSFVSSG